MLDFCRHGRSEDLRAAGEALLEYRASHLIAEVEGIAVGTACLSSIEYQCFLDESAEKGQWYHPDHWRDRTLPEGATIAPVVGVRYRDALAFCAWFTAWCQKRGPGDYRYRLPTQGESAWAGNESTPLPELLKPLDPRHVSTWCQGEPPIVAGGMRPEQPRDLYNYARSFFNLECLLAVDLNFLYFIRCGMPERVYDWDFNEHYEHDRRYIKMYASCIEHARTTLSAIEGSLGKDLGFGQMLAFDPLHNLRGKSPLDRYRDQVLTAYRKLIQALALHDGPVLQDVIDRHASRSLASDTPLPEKMRLNQDFETSLARTLEAPLDLDISLDRIRPFDRNRDTGEGAWFDPSVVRELIGELTRVRAREAVNRPDLDTARFLAIDNALGSSNEVPREQDLFRRLFRKGEQRSPERPRDAFFDTYGALLLLEERIKGTAPAWEGIRLVRERVTP